MADEQQRGSFGCQDTGNPVLDSTVNILCACGIGGRNFTMKTVEELHATLLTIAQKEPGGLACRGTGGLRAAETKVSHKATVG